MKVLSVLLLLIAAPILVQCTLHKEEPVLPPPATSFPREMTPGSFPSSDVPRLVAVPPPPPLPLASVPAEQFPTDPRKPPPSDIPPPLSPSGRWLHSSVLLDGKLFVFGGVGSYSTALYNDLWLYNFAERSWSELQASFVPPFPVDAAKNPLANLPKGPLNMFRPADAPPQPPMRAEPENAPAFKPIPSEEQSAALKAPGLNTLDPVFKAPQDKPLPVEKYTTLPDLGVSKPPGYSFLETDMSLAHGVPPASLLLETSEHFQHLHATISGRSHIRKARSKKQKRVSFVELSAGPEPPQFWKSDKLAPTLMSPFIAADLWQYDLETKLWTNIKSKSRDVPAPRWLHTAVGVQGRMVIFGGVSYSDTILGDVWVFTPTSRSWRKANPKGDPILPREGHSAVVMQKNKMFVFGGVSYGQVPFNDLWIYDSTRNAWALQQPKGVTPPPRWLHTAAVHVDGKKVERMFIFGGVTRNFVPLDDLWIYEPKGKKWFHPTSSTYPPFPRMLHTSAVCHDYLFVFGGVANNIPLEDSWVFDIVNMRWDEEYPDGPYPFAREGASIVTVLPPPPKYKAQDREPWIPPPPKAITDDRSPAALMPLLKKTISPRPLNRFRKEYNLNRFLIVFGGAGPKPQ